MPSEERAERTVCLHGVAGVLCASQCADDEIQVIVGMSAEGQCPICVGGPETFKEYLWRVEAVRKGSELGTVQA